MAVTLDAERQRKAERYASRKRFLFVCQLALGALYVGGVILTGLAASFRDTLGVAPLGAVGLVGVYFLALWLGYTILTFPFSVIGGWLLPSRYGISVQTAGGWFGDWVKGEGIGFVIALLMVEVVYALLRLLPQLWWLATAIVYLFFTVGLAHLGPVLLLPLFYKLTPLDNPALTERLTSLANQAGTRVKGVYRMNLSAKTTAANAALTGLGNTRRVILGDTLLDCYTPAEIEVVFAHELGHHVHRDIPWMILGQSVVTLAALYVTSIALIYSTGVLGYHGISDVATLPFLVLTLGVIGAITTPLANWVSRRMERSADCYALATTQNPDAFISTMIRLANQNLAVFRPPRWVEILFYDHPSIADRVTAAENFAKGGRCA